MKSVGTTPSCPGVTIENVLREELNSTLRRSGVHGGAEEVGCAVPAGGEAQFLTRGCVALQLCIGSPRTINLTPFLTLCWDPYACVCCVSVPLVKERIQVVGSRVLGYIYDVLGYLGMFWDVLGCFQ